jgi:hypothetical protein
MIGGAFISVPARQGTSHATDVIRWAAPISVAGPPEQGRFPTLVVWKHAILGAADDACRTPADLTETLARVSRRTNGRSAMAFKVKRVEYYYTTVKDQPGEAYKLLAQLSSHGVNLLAFAAVPIGPVQTQLTLFPEDIASMAELAQKAGLLLDGPHPAFLVQGDDQLGALAEVHGKLYEANANVYASTGVADGHGAYEYVLYVRPDAFERAAKALGV